MMRPVNIIVIGASKGVGRHVVETALKAGHSVTAFSRNPENIDLQHQNLRLQSGDALDKASLHAVMSGHDAVVCALGLPTLKAIGPPLATRSYVLSTGTENILQAMKDANIQRLVCVTAIGASESKHQCTLPARIVLRYGLHWLFKEKDRQENLIKNSAIDWTLIRPTALTNGRAKGALQGGNLRAGMLSHVSRADVAKTIIEVLPKVDTYHQALVVSYKPRLGDSVRWIAGYLGAG